MATPTFCSINGDTTNQSIGASYLDISDAVQAEQARRFLDPTSLPPIPENSGATEQARQSSEQLAQVTQSTPKPRWIIPNVISYTPAGYVGPALAAGCTAGEKGTSDTNDSELMYLGGIISVGCEDSVFDEIQDAINVASDGDIIEVCDGTYGTFETYQTENISLTIRAKNGHHPKIDLTDQEPIYFNGYSLSDGYSESKIVFEGFEIYGGFGYAVYVSDIQDVVLSKLTIHDSGSAIIIDSGNPDLVSISLNDLELYDNEYGGLVIELFDSPSDLNLQDIEIYNNSGPAISIMGEEELSSVIADKLNLYDNGNTEEVGGGIYIHGGEASISDSTITNNIGYAGGGIYASATTLILTDTVVQYNVVTDPFGGGMELVTGYPTSSEDDGITAKVTAYNTDWDKTNEPYDVSAEDNSMPHYDPILVYNYGINASFQCESEVGCTDL